MRKCDPQHAIGLLNGQADDATSGGTQLADGPLNASSRQPVLDLLAQGAYDARRPAPGWAAALVGVLLPAITVRALALAPMPQWASLLGTNPGVAHAAAADLIATLVVLGPLALVAWLSPQLIEGRAPVRDAAPALPAAAWGGLLGVVAFGCALAIALAHAQVSAVFSGLTAIGAAAAPLTVAVQTAIEEKFFRGWLQPILSARWGPGAGLACASLIFSVAHSWGHGISVLAFVNDALAGAAFGLMAIRTGGLWAPVAAHFAWNFTEAHLLGAFPNPGIDPLGSILDVDFAGAGIWTGGSEGLNGALGTSLVLLCLIAAVYRTGPRAIFARSSNRDDPEAATSSITSSK
jgi:membrane protease YdiL (CAAX protease family)